jgi:tetratricopeptide (TPR) repeat protein
MISSYLMFFLVLGFVASVAVPREEPTLRKNISVKSWFALIFLILFAFSFFYFVIQPLKTSYYTVASLGVPAASSAGRLDLYKKALASSPLGKYQIREFFGQTTLGFAQSGQGVEQIPVENFKEELDFVIEELEKSVAESPLDFRAYLKLGQLYNSYLRLGQLYNTYTVLLDPTKMSGAERVLERAIEISPTNQQGYWSLAQTRVYQGKLDEALSLAEKAVALEPNLFQSHFVVIQITKIMGDNELTQRKIEEAIEIDPAWATSLTSTPN